MGNTASSSLNDGQQHSPSMTNAAQEPPAECPMHRQGGNEASTSTAKTSSVVADILNPLNNIPALPQGPLSASQKRALSLDRTYSSIPRSSDGSVAPAASAAPAACPVAHGDMKGKAKAADQDAASANNWVYPSPQQFYNALMRKGKETPEESVDSMVEIHNFLNEKAWDEIRRWEDRRSPNERIELARFEGRPDQLSPKARYHLFLGRLFPATHNTTPPFDRHDWHVRRADDGTMQRYVIDYYSCPDDENGMPVFSLDVRPAVDSAGAVYERMTEWARVKREAWTAPTSQAQNQTS